MGSPEVFQLVRIGMFQVEFQSFLEVFQGFLNGLALACNLQLQTMSNIPFVFFFHYCGELIHLQFTGKFTGKLSRSLFLTLSFEVQAEQAVSRHRGGRYVNLCSRVILAISKSWMFLPSRFFSLSSWLSKSESELTSNIRSASYEPMLLI